MEGRLGKWQWQGQGQAQWRTRLGESVAGGSAYGEPGSGSGLLVTLY